MILGLRHVGIVVSDLERQVDFYCGVLGFRVLKRMDESGEEVDRMLGIEDADVTTVKLIAPGGGVVELLKFHSPECRESDDRELHDLGISHIALTLTDLYAEYADLSRKGVRFISPVERSGDAYVAFCFDPEGNVLELVQATQ